MCPFRLRRHPAVGTQKEPVVTMDTPAGNTYKKAWQSTVGTSSSKNPCWGFRFSMYPAASNAHLKALRLNLVGLLAPRIYKVFGFLGKTKDGRDIAHPTKGRLNPGRLAALRTCYSLLRLRSTGMAFYMKSPGADSRHNRFGISQCHGEAVAHRHGHSYRTVSVLDLDDPCLGIRHADEMSFTISVRYHWGPPFLL